MTDIPTPTDEVVDQSSSDIRDESLLDTSNEQDSAVERQEDTDSGDTSQESDSEHSSSTEDSSNEDKGLYKFAKSQGFDPDNLTDGERRALKLAHDNQKAFRKKQEDEANQAKVDDELNEMHQPDENDGPNDVVLKRLALMEARDTTRTFWEKHQDDRQYEPYMVEVLQKEREQFGDEAARALTANLPRLLREAKYLAGANDSDAARDAGRKEEREKLRKLQEGAADTAHASQSSSQSTTKIDRDWVENTYDPSNAEHQKLLDTAIKRGDLY